MAVAKKKSTSSSFIGYGTNVKRGKAIAKTTVAKVRNRVTAAGGPDVAGVKARKIAKMNDTKRTADMSRAQIYAETKMNKSNPDSPSYRAEAKRSAKLFAARKQARSMNKKRG